MDTKTSLTFIWNYIIPIVFPILCAWVSYYFGKKTRLGVEIKAKHRQYWINSIREDLSFIISKSFYLNMDLSNEIEVESIDTGSSTKNSSHFVSLFHKIEQKIFNVILFLNKNEDLHQKLILKLNELNDINIKISNLNIDERKTYSRNLSVQLKGERELFNKLIKEIIYISTDIFKVEWEKVKAGK